jgi:hypothetical protein
MKIKVGLQKGLCPKNPGFDLIFLQIKTLADNATRNQKICGFNGSVTCSWSIHPLGSTWTEKDLGAKYLGFFSSRSLKTREKCISFAQLVYFLRKVCLLFNF